MVIASSNRLRYWFVRSRSLSLAARAPQICLARLKVILEKT